jgi:hypothetical protein
MGAYAKAIELCGKFNTLNQFGALGNYITLYNVTYIYNIRYKHNVRGAWSCNASEYRRYQRRCAAALDLLRPEQSGLSAFRCPWSVMATCISSWFAQPWRNGSCRCICGNWCKHSNILLRSHGTPIPERLH